MINRKRLVFNAAANVASGSASAVVAIVLPAIFARHMPLETFNIWALILQIGAYTGYLNLGIQIAVGRYIALHTELNEPIKRNQIASSAFGMLAVLAMAGCVLTLALSWLLPTIFKDIPPALVQDARIALLLVGGSLSVGLPFNTFSAMFTGLQRNHIPAYVTIVSKALQGLALALGAIYGAGLLELAIIFACTNFLMYGLHWGAYRAYIQDIFIELKFFNNSTVKEIGRYCISLTVWSLAMLMISGLDATIVGIYDFHAIAAFTVAASLVTFIAGFQTAIFNALISVGATLSANSNNVLLGDLLLKSTLYGVGLLLLIGLPVILLANQILTLWVGAKLAGQAADILQILMVGNIIRLTATPYATLLIATGQQQKIILMPFIEGAINLIVSIYLSSKLGVIGVAIGTVIGSFAGFFGNIIFNMKKTQNEMKFDIGKYLKNSILYPSFVCLFPIALLMLYRYFHAGAYSNVRYVYEAIFVIGISFSIYMYLYASPSFFNNLKKQLLKF